MKKRKALFMESGKISFGFLLILLLVFGLAAGAGWLVFSDTKTGIPVVDNNIAKIQTMVGQGEQAADLLPVDGDHTHGVDEDHTHDDVAQNTMNDQNVPGKEGQIYDKPVAPLLGVRGIGNPDAPVQVREFFSLTCNHCATFHESTYSALKQKYIDTGKVYLIFEEFPLNGPALYGSMIARCMPEERYESFVSLLLQEQDKWAFGGDFKASLKQNAALAGMGDEAFEECFNNQELQKTIAQNIQESSDIWKISSTPSFVFNNGERILSGVRSVEDFEKIIAYLTDGAVATPQEAPMEETPAADQDIMDLFDEGDSDDVDAETPAMDETSMEEPAEEEAPKLEDTSININDLYAQ